MREYDIHGKPNFITYYFHKAFKPDPPMKGSWSCRGHTSQVQLANFEERFSCVLRVYVHYSIVSNSFEYYYIVGCHGTQTSFVN